MDRRPAGSPRCLDRLVSHCRAADSNVAEGAVRVPHEEPGDDRLRLIVLRAPDVKPARLRKEISRTLVLARG
jgi:hypothetical protein